jgi:hypothetical protein
MIELLKFSHDRKAPLKQSCDALRDIIDAFVEQPELDGWYNHFEKCYSLPKDTIKQDTKRYIESVYDYRSSSFLKKLFWRHIPKSLVIHVGFLFYGIFRSKNYSGTIKTFDLIVEWIASDIELHRFSKLINLFGKKNTLVTATIPIVEPGYNIIIRPPYKNYDQKETILMCIKEIRRGLRVYLKLSNKLGINFIPIATSIIHKYIYYYSIFKYNRSKYCIQERHYQTSAIKNYLFHKFEGIYSCSIQKNLHLLGSSGFYYDIDVLFSLGNKTAKRAFECGARIQKVVPVGSMFMEYYWFNSKKNKKSFAKTYDIVYLGINVSMALHYVDSYSSFIDDYYETFRWLADFSKENSHLKIGIKHHKGNKVDEREMEIIKNSNVERIDEALNSYQRAFQSKCAVTFGSTMGYELLAHGLPALFLDPGGRCALLPEPKESLLSLYRVYDFQAFKDRLNRLLSGQSLEINEKFNKNDLCKESNTVSENIFNWFSSNNHG